MQLLLIGCWPNIHPQLGGPGHLIQSPRSVAFTTALESDLPMRSYFRQLRHSQGLLRWNCHWSPLLEYFFWLLPSDLSNKGDHTSSCATVGIAQRIIGIHKFHHLLQGLVLPRWSSGVHCDVEKLPHAVVHWTLSRGKCRDSCGHGCADWESRRLWGARCYLFSAGQWDLRLSYQRGKLSRGIILLPDKACPHTARQTQALLCEQFHWDSFEHPPYSLDLAPSDFFLFPKMEHLAGKRFANDEDLKDASWITRLPHGIKRVYTNWCQGTTSALTWMKIIGYETAISGICPWQQRTKWVALWVAIIWITW